MPTDASTPLIPRRVFFGNPERAAPQLSPDGTQLSWLADKEGVLNVWVAPLDDLDAARCITDDRSRGIHHHAWAYDGKHVLFLQDQGGDENWHVYAVDLETQTTRDLTPIDGVQARIEQLSPKHPQHLIVALNDRQAELHDLHRVHIPTGEREPLLENPGFLGFNLDDDFNVRIAMTMTPDGGTVLMHRASEDEEWQPLIQASPDDALTTGAVGLDPEGQTLFLIDSRERDTAALVSLDLGAAEPANTPPQLLHVDPQADVAEIMTHPTTRAVQAVATNYLRRSWALLDESVKADLERLNAVADGELDIASQSLDNQKWIVSYVRDDGPVSYYLHDRATGAEPRFLFTNRPALEQYALTKQHAVEISARDGLNLVSYLSLPPHLAQNGKPAEPLPMVLLVHGGPWARDSWGYNPEHQWLANRGYAVLSVNFRGSTGFGKKFLNAANYEWGAKMHDDLLDAVDWAVDQGIAQRDKIAIMGGSYGGYSTLVGLTFTPEVFACGVDIVGVSNLVTLLESVPDYWKPMLDMFKARVGDHGTEEGRAFLMSRSPLSKVDAIQRPLLIGQGANDPRVKQAESDQIVGAMQAKQIPVTYVLYPDEGHGFARPENNLSFDAITEAFLAQHLGGRSEPIGEDFSGASLEVREGAAHIPGLDAALQS